MVRQLDSEILQLVTDADAEIKDASEFSLTIAKVLRKAETFITTSPAQKNEKKNKKKQTDFISYQSQYIESHYRLMLVENIKVQIDILNYKGLGTNKKVFIYLVYA